jgi:hypothetical protein
MKRGIAYSLTNGTKDATLDTTILIGTVTVKTFVKRGVTFIFLESSNMLKIQFCHEFS